MRVVLLGLWNLEVSKVSILVVVVVVVVVVVEK